MYLKTDKIVATIGGITMRSYKEGLSKEYVLDPSAVSGWLDGTNVRRDAAQRLNSHGDFSEQGYMSARVISFTGTAIADTITNLEAMRDEFTAILSDGSYQQLKVETNTSARYATVGLEANTSWIRQSDTIASFKINFYAPDPFIYSLEKKLQVGMNSVQGGLQYRLAYPLDYNIIGVNTTQTVKNYGNAPSWPKFTVTGDYFSGFTISDNLGKSVSYLGMVTYAAPVEIDMARGTALQNGVDKSSLLVNRDWFSIPAGATIQPVFTPLQNGSGWCDIMYKDTWI